MIFYTAILKPILSNSVFLRFPIFTVKLGHFTVNTFFHMLQTLKLNSKKRKNFAFPKKKSLIGSTPGFGTMKSCFPKQMAEYFYVLSNKSNNFGLNCTILMFDLFTLQHRLTKNIKTKWQQNHIECI